MNSYFLFFVPGKPIYIIIIKKIDSNLNPTRRKYKIASVAIRMASGIDYEIKPFTCMECSKSYPTKAQLKSHKMVHSDEKPHKCNDCRKTFKRKNELVSHITWIHSSEKPFSCKIVTKGLVHQANS